jgi:ABC-type branched-subunit amino acid transport system substrate-binding protein
VAGAEALLGGVLVFVAGSLLVATTWRTVDATLAVQAAAREAARAYAEAPDETTAVTAAGDAARAVLAAHRLLDPRHDHLVTITADPGFQRCATVTVDVRAVLPAVAVPAWGGVGTRAVTGRHATVVDAHRSAAELPEGDCP